MPAPPIATVREAFGENFFYMIYYQEPGVAEAELNPNVRAVLTRVMVSPDTPRHPPKITDPRASAGGLLDRLAVPRERPPWLSKEDLDHLVTEYERTGFRGGLNYYRNIDRSWELTPQLADARVQVPALFIGGEKDPVLLGRDVTSTEDPMHVVAPKLTAVHLLPGTGHWVHLERPAKVNGLLIAFLKGSVGKP